MVQIVVVFILQLVHANIGLVPQTTFLKTNVSRSVQFGNVRRSASTAPSSSWQSSLLLFDPRVFQRRGSSIIELPNTCVFGFDGYCMYIKSHAHLMCVSALPYHISIYKLRVLSRCENPSYVPEELRDTYPYNSIFQPIMSSRQQVHAQCTSRFHALWI